MTAFRYQAMEGNGAAVGGIIEAEDRQTALRLLGDRGLFPSTLEVAPAMAAAKATDAARSANSLASLREAGAFGKRVSRKDITAFTREMSALLAAAIPIPQALDGLADEENPALREVISKIAESVRKGSSLSSALQEDPALFPNLYVSMIRVGEEAGVLPKVMSDLADLLEHEDEVRSEVVSAVAYPLFVLGFGVVTVTVLLTWVMPRLFGMLQEMLHVLPWPTLLLLKVSGFMHHYWLGVVLGVPGAIGGLWYYSRTPEGGELWDRPSCGYR
ncbi:MAG TPA: type II secretion system F family protein [Verrucomicrobiae bacterium]|nr:type II secretion system F family protein [Verrucomicrobiae bacterium]